MDFWKDPGKLWKGLLEFAGYSGKELSETRHFIPEFSCKK